MARSKKDIDFELNLLPVISLLAVCISFLLLTTAWVHIGSMDVSQALGDDKSEEKENPPSVWITFEDSNQISLVLKDAKDSPKTLRSVTLVGTTEGPDWDGVENYAKTLKEQMPDVKTALILPGETTPYSDLIRAMDELKKQDMKNIGITPL